MSHLTVSVSQMCCEKSERPRMSHRALLKSITESFPNKNKVTFLLSRVLLQFLKESLVKEKRHGWMGISRSFRFDVVL